MTPEHLEELAEDASKQWRVGGKDSAKVAFIAWVLWKIAAQICDRLDRILEKLEVSD